MSPKLPTRYEDLEPTFRAQLRAVPALNALVQEAATSMKVGGGIRFLPVYGRSGSGKSCAVLEVATHLPQTRVVTLSKSDIQGTSLLATIERAFETAPEFNQLIIAVVDQYEEQAARKDDLPKSFIERLAHLDRNELRQKPVLFVWLTTDPAFRDELAAATSRNERLLLRKDFVLEGPPKTEWSVIEEETYRFHNANATLADVGILTTDLKQIAAESDTLGQALQKTGARVLASAPTLQDLSEFRVIMLWPVTDGERIAKVSTFTDARAGYRLDWNSWYQQLSPEDARALPLHEYNRARLYFDMRLVPIAAADLMDICVRIDDETYEPNETARAKFARTHFSYIIQNSWNPETYSPMRERESERAEKALKWYEEMNSSPTKIGKRIAKTLTMSGLQARYEHDVSSVHSAVRADVFVESSPTLPQKTIIELKAFSPTNTMPSTIRNQIRETLRRHAQFAGFLARQ